MAPQQWGQEGWGSLGCSQPHPAAQEPLLCFQSVPQPALRVPTQAGATSKGGARVPLAGDIYPQGRASLAPRGWLGAQGKHLYPRHAVCGVKKLFHILGHDCCIQPCSCLCFIHTPNPEPWGFASWRSCSGCPQRAHEASVSSLGGQLGPSQTLKGHFYSFMHFLSLFRASWGKASACPSPSLQSAGREGAFLGGWGWRCRGSSPRVTLGCQVILPPWQAMFRGWMG